MPWVFEHAQDRPYTIAHHNHVPGPVRNAVRPGLPTIVLIRDPVDAVISHRALRLQIGATEGEDMPDLIPYELRLRAWQGFYRRIGQVRDEIVVAPFEVVITGFGQVIDALNKRFCTSFARFEHSVENVNIIRGSHGYHALPMDERERLKRQARTRFEEGLGEGHPEVNEALSLYRRYRDSSSL